MSPSTPNNPKESTPLLSPSINDTTHDNTNDNNPQLPSQPHYQHQHQEEQDSDSDTEGISSIDGIITNPTSMKPRSYSITSAASYNRKRNASFSFPPPPHGDEDSDDSSTLYLDAKNFWKSSKLGTLTILFSILVVCILLVFVGVILAVTVAKHFHQRNESIQLNIHVKLSQQCEDKAIAINQRILQLDEKQQIDLKLVQQPHITLYLTSFQEKNYQVFAKLVEKLVQTEFSDEAELVWPDQDVNSSQLPSIRFNAAVPCEVTCESSNMTSVSNYAMWPVTNPKCLQNMSDRIVTKISPYITNEAKSTIPEWIHSLPPFVQKQKIDMIHNYGSPNVFSQFVPHVTLAYDDNKDRLQEAFDKAGHDLVGACTFTVEEIAFGQVGPWGTVLRGKDKEQFRFKKDE